MSNLIVTCEWCLTSFETEYDTKRFCSRNHKEQARKYRQKGRQFCNLYTFVCATCNSSNASRKPNQKYCSLECYNFPRSQERREKEKARAKGLRAKLYFRDFGKCQFCFELVDIALSYPHPKSLSVDHIIPISKGGSSAIDNLQIAHLDCNVKAGAKL